MRVFGHSGSTQIASERSVENTSVKATANSGSSFFNYKGFFGFVLMAACDANYSFTFVDIGAFGRESDAGIFSRTQFREQLLQPSQQCCMKGAASVGGGGDETPCPAGSQTLSSSAWS